MPSNYLKEVLDIKNALIIPNAVSEKLIEKSLETKKLSDKNTINLIMVTMFGFREKSEGALKVITALSKIKSDKKIHLNIFGKGSFEEEIKKRALQIKMPENITVNFKGYAKNINDEYEKADIFVYWSDLDVMPNVFLEAMAFGLPIIANNFPSFKEILGENNFIAKNEKEFTDYAENLFGNSKTINKISLQNKKLVLQYDIDRIISFWINLF